MRDPKRIKPILEIIEKLWKKNPELRLTQLLMNALSMNSDPYFIEDDTLLDCLNKLEMRKDNE